MKKLTNSIQENNKAKAGETSTISTAESRDTIYKYSDYLKDNFKTLTSFGMSAKDIYATAAKATGYDKVQAQSINVTQNILTTNASPSETKMATQKGLKSLQLAGDLA